MSDKKATIKTLPYATALEQALRAVGKDKKADEAIRAAFPEGETIREEFKPLLGGTAAQRCAAAYGQWALAVASGIFANGSRAHEFYDVAARAGMSRSAVAIGLHAGGSMQAKAFGAMLETIGSALTSKARQLDQDGHDAAVAACAAAYAAACTVTARAAPNEAKAASAARAKAFNVVTGTATTWTSTEVDAIRAALAAYDGLQDAKPAKPAKPAKASKPTEPVPA